MDFVKKPLHAAATILPVTTPVHPTNHLRCIAYAIKTIFRVLPALGRSTDHVDPPPGLGIKHFVVGGVICAALLVGTIITAVSVILKLVTAK